MKQIRGLSILAALTLTSCGGGGGGGSAPPSNTGGGTPPLQANFDSIQDNVLTAICTSCHIGASAPLGLRLDAVNAFALLVGVASAQVPGLLRVDPGDPNNSYLIQKLEGTAAVGGRMPLGGSALAQADIDVIRQWIADGALAMPQPPPAAPIRVTSLSPVPGSMFDTLPASVIAIFDRELDATSVDASTFIIERSGGDDDFSNGNEVIITAASILVSTVNPMTATFDLTGVASVNDTYRVRLLGTGATTIGDLDANALDGEFSGAFPSGDGTAGGDFTAQFVVEALVPTIESIQSKIFSTTCFLGCHTGPPGPVLPAGMDLSDTDASFNSLVMTQSIEVPALFRVLPDDPDNSYLIQKLEGAAGIGGQRMPLGGPFLDQATIDVIRQWITDGANR